MMIAVTYTQPRARLVLHALIAVVLGPCLTLWAAEASPLPQAKPQLAKRLAIHGCLSRSKLTHVDPQDPIPLELPDTLRVMSIRVIRGQVKALDGHQVEVIATLHGIPGQENGILIADSDRGRVYIGGADRSLGEDLAPGHEETPTINAYTIKDLAPACTVAEPK